MLLDNFVNSSLHVQYHAGFIPPQDRQFAPRSFTEWLIVTDIILKPLKSQSFQR